MKKIRLVTLLCVILTAITIVIVSARCLTNANVKSDYVNVDVTIDYVDQSADASAR